MWTYDKPILTRHCGICIERDKISPEMNPTYISYNFLDKVQRQFSGERTMFSGNVAGNLGSIHTHTHKI